MHLSAVFWPKTRLPRMHWQSGVDPGYFVGGPLEKIGKILKKLGKMDKILKTLEKMDKILKKLEKKLDKIFKKLENPNSYHKQ